MTRFRRYLLVVVACLPILMPGLSQAQSNPLVPNLSGDQQNACSALLCLAGGQTSGACSPSTQIYYSITGRTPGDVIQNRLNFLNQCPASQQDSNMQSLVNALANGSGHCDAATLNQQLQFTVGGCGGDCGTPGTVEISNQLPSYCVALENNPYTENQDIPRYIGTPAAQGFWADPGNYDSQLAQYQQQQAALAQQQAQQQQYSNGGN